MKKNSKIVRLALLGLANGLLLNAPGILAASNQQNVSPFEAVNAVAAISKGVPYAMASCKGSKGCGNAVAASCKGAKGCNGVVAASCKGAKGCNGVVAASCKGAKGCNGVVAASCKGAKGCNGVVAASCKGAKGCNGVVAVGDVPEKTKLIDPAKTPAKDDKEDANDENLGYHLLSEKELMLELNDEGIKQYNSLSPEGKQLAREVASARCGRTNKCAGLNACETETHTCAGKGSCAGTGKCAFSDKNVAVRVVAEKMSQKRAGALQLK